MPAGFIPLPQFIKWSDYGNADINAKLWLIEAKTRFTDPIVFTSHGSYSFVHELSPDGKPVKKAVWVVVPDKPRNRQSVQGLAETLANLYPDKDIILTSCNELGHDIKVNRVWYARSMIWVTPDRFVLMGRETTRDFGAVGSIWEFVSYDGRELEKPPTRPTSRTTSHPTTVPTTGPASVQAVDPS